MSTLLILYRKFLILTILGSRACFSQCLNMANLGSRVKPHHLAEAFETLGILNMYIHCLMFAATSVCKYIFKNKQISN